MHINFLCGMTAMKVGCGSGTILVCGMWANNSVDSIIPKTPASAHFHWIIFFSVLEPAQILRILPEQVSSLSIAGPWCWYIAVSVQTYPCRCRTIATLHHGKVSVIYLTPKKLPLFKEQILWLLEKKKDQLSSLGMF